jgi:hypothetical protein
MREKRPPRGDLTARLSGWADLAEVVRIVVELRTAIL